MLDADAGKEHRADAPLTYDQFHGGDCALPLEDVNVNH
jgi:hypothetical protein